MKIKWWALGLALVLAACGEPGHGPGEVEAKLLIGQDTSKDGIGVVEITSSEDLGVDAVEQDIGEDGGDIVDAVDGADAIGGDADAVLEVAGEDADVVDSADVDSADAGSDAGEDLFDSGNEVVEDSADAEAEISEDLAETQPTEDLVDVQAEVDAGGATDVDSPDVSEDGTDASGDTLEVQEDSSPDAEVFAEDATPVVADTADSDSEDAAETVIGDVQVDTADSTQDLVEVTNDGASEIAADPCVSKNCDDGNICTADSCNNGSCVHAPASGACTTGNACTINDLCDAGVCKPGAAKVCDDNDVCTTDTCSATAGCEFKLVSSLMSEDFDAPTAWGKGKGVSPIPDGLWPSNWSHVGLWDFGCGATADPFVKCQLWYGDNNPPGEVVATLQLGVSQHVRSVALDAQFFGDPVWQSKLVLGARVLDAKGLVVGLPIIFSDNFVMKPWSDGPMGHFIVEVPAAGVAIQLFAARAESLEKQKQFGYSGRFDNVKVTCQ